MDIEDSVVAHFKTSVGRYSHEILELNRFAVKAFEPFAKKKIKLLDIGCGTGHLLEDIYELHPRFDLYGLDITPAMIHAAHAIRPHEIGFMLGSSLQLPFENGTFDAIILYDVLHHLIANRKSGSDVLREACLREVLRIVRSGGFIVIQEACVHSHWRAALIFFFSFVFSKLHPAIPAVNFYDLRELESTLARYALTIVDKEIRPYRSLVGWLSTLGSHTTHVTYALLKG